MSSCLLAACSFFIHSFKVVVVTSFALFLDGFIHVYLLRCSFSCLFLFVFSLYFSYLPSFMCLGSLNSTNTANAIIVLFFAVFSVFPPPSLLFLCQFKKWRETGSFLLHRVKSVCRPRKEMCCLLILAQETTCNVCGLFIAIPKFAKKRKHATAKETSGRQVEEQQIYLVSEF